MKRIITIFILAMATSCVLAQQNEDSNDIKQLIVYEVNGNVTSIMANKETPVERKQCFSFNDVIKLSENSFIKILDKEQQKMYTLRNQCQGMISALIDSQAQASKNLTKQYFAYVMRNLTRSDLDPIYNTGLTTTTYRNDADSLLCDIDSLQNDVDILHIMVDSLKNVINTLTANPQKNK